MPQMYPLNWILLPLIILLCIYFLMTLTYFFFMFENFEKNSFKKCKNLNILFKW